MKILLLGEYSNVHWTLAQGLRQFGHKVTVISNGDFWKNYPRDIDIQREKGKIGGLKLWTKLIFLLPQLRGYDIVQLINPLFLELKAERIFFFYNYLRKHNKKIVLGAYGMDYYWIKINITDMPLRYSDFNIDKTLRTNKDAIKEQKDWLGTAKEKLNKYIAQTADGIVAGLYEYKVCYDKGFKNKTVFIPFPIKLKKIHITKRPPKQQIKIFIGISKKRSQYKGTDIMLKAAQKIKEKYPNKVQLKIVEGVPFKEYIKAMIESDILLDQLYSYTPAMNALEAMSNGIIVIGGGEDENYKILKEKTLRPIINVLPTYESCFNEIQKLVLNPNKIDLLKKQSIDYINKHHNYTKVAKQYIDFYNTLM